MARWTFLPTSKLRRIISLTAAFFLCLPIFLYFSLIGIQCASMWQARRALDHLEALRLGAPASDVVDATRSMHCSENLGYRHCDLIAGAYRSEKALRYFSKIPEPVYSKVRRMLPRIGLQYWVMSASANTAGGKLDFVTVGIIVEGRHRSLGSGWFLSTEVPRWVLERHQLSPLTPTAVNRFAITSDWPGGGREFYFTPRSTNFEMSARHISQNCLGPFHSCDDLRDLLPNALEETER
jgi:hypothetical protein